MRKLKIADPANTQPTVYATHEGIGGASTQYHVVLGGHVWSPDCNEVVIPFQDGTVPEAGLNGVTNEVLLAIVHDRLSAFQAGKFPCGENHSAMLAVQEAMFCLEMRSKKRMERAVEGKLLA